MDKPGCIGIHRSEIIGKGVDFFRSISSTEMCVLDVIYFLISGTKNDRNASTPSPQHRASS